MQRLPPESTVDCDSGDVPVQRWGFWAVVLALVSWGCIEWIDPAEYDLSAPILYDPSTPVTTTTTATTTDIWPEIHTTTLDALSSSSILTNQSQCVFVGLSPPPCPPRSTATAPTPQHEPARQHEVLQQLARIFRAEIEANALVLAQVEDIPSLPIAPATVVWPPGGAAKGEGDVPFWPAQDVGAGSEGGSITTDGLSYLLGRDDFLSSSRPAHTCGLRAWQVFAPRVRDRSCLLRRDAQSYAHLPESSVGYTTSTAAADTSHNTAATAATVENSVPGLVQFINTQCQFHRTVTGALTAKGERVQALYDSLHRPTSPFVERIPVTASTTATTTTNASSTSDNDNNNDNINAAFSPRVFRDEYLLRSRPVLLEGASLHWPAHHRWTDEYLLALFGEREVHVKLGERGVFEGPEPVEWWERDGADSSMPDYVREQLESPDKVIARPAYRKMLFKDFLAPTEPVVGDVAHYVEYTQLEEGFTELREDILTPPLLDDVLELESVNLWIGTRATVGKTHFDEFDNLLCVVKGTKTVTLFPPYDNRRMYEGHVREGMLQYDEASGMFRRDVLSDTTSMVMSPVDLTRPREELLADYPLFAEANATRVEVVVREGDVLFIPAWWWHNVATEPPTADGWSDSTAAAAAGAAGAGGKHQNTQRDVTEAVKERMTTTAHIAVNYWYAPFYRKEFPCAECPLVVSDLALV